MRRYATASLALMLLAGANAYGGFTLYATTYTGDLLTINPTTGAGTLVGSSGFSGMEGLTWAADGNLYASAGTSLVKLDRSTEMGQLVGSTGVLLEGLAAVGDVIYGAADAGGAPIAAETLARVDPVTGDVTLIGPFGGPYQDVNGIAVSSGGSIFGVNSTVGDPTRGALVRIDPVSGSATEVVQYTGILTDMAFGADGTLYAVTIPDVVLGGSSHLIILDPSTGSIVDVGPIGFDTVTSLAFVPQVVPEPSAWLLAILGLPFVIAAPRRYLARP